MLWFFFDTYVAAADAVAAAVAVVIGIIIFVFITFITDDLWFPYIITGWAGAGSATWGGVVVSVPSSSVIVVSPAGWWWAAGGGGVGWISGIIRCIWSIGACWVISSSSFSSSSVFVFLKSFISFVFSDI